MTKLWSFESTDDCMRFALRTKDPRVVAVVHRDIHDAQPPDGDAYAPAYYLGYRGGYTVERAGDAYHDDESDLIAKAWVRARDHFRYVAGYRWDGLSVGMIVKSEAMLERYMRIFWGVREVRSVSSTVWQGGDDVLIFDTPNYRAHVGIPDDAVDVLRGDVETWQAYLDGDVYGVGVLVNPEHVLWGEDEDTPTDEYEGEGEGVWEFHDGPIWGHYGDDWAAEAALEAANWEIERLPELLPF